MSSKTSKELFITVSNVVVFPQTVQRIRLAEDIELNDRHVVVIFTKKQQTSPTGVLCELIDQHHQSDGRYVVLEEYNGLILLIK